MPAPPLVGSVGEPSCPKQGTRQGLAQPLLQGYAQREPVKLIAYGAGTGALLWILKPWKLLSAATVVTLIFRGSDVAAMVSGLVQRANGSIGKALPGTPFPTLPESSPMTAASRNA